MSGKWNDPIVILDEPQNNEVCISDHVDEADLYKLPTPPQFLCPISGEIMVLPVTTPTNITYCWTKLSFWLDTNPTCPMTRIPIPRGTKMYRNLILEELIGEWKNNNKK